MYCDKPHINQLTALLKGHGFEDIVVCPGSRNGALVHNFHAAQFRLHPVTDERSAAFFALGLCLSTHRPVALCVTSGSALLNTIPAVAEAYYRQLPLLVISADRPKEWINQLDGQTLSQDGALQPYAPTYTLGETSKKVEENWYNLRMNEALLSLLQNGGQPIHINVPFSEPLFSFHTAKLPETRIIQEERTLTDQPFSEVMLQRIRNAQLPIIVMGQFEKGRLQDIEEIEHQGALLFLPEIITHQKYSWRTNALEHLLPNFEFAPDLVIHIGGNLVNKQLKLHLRRLDDCEVIRVEPGPQMPDTFGHLTTIVRTSPEIALRQLATIQAEKSSVREYQKKLDAYQVKARTYNPEKFSDLGVLQKFCEDLPKHSTFQIGNSSVIRNAAYFLDTHNESLFCNRGVNGIEGSLSAAVGYATGNSAITYSLIGDLSFFYDQNALWNKELPKNLRIILFNNGGGQIFYRLPGLDQTPALSPYIAAAHQTHAQGVAQSYGLNYLAAHDYDELEKCLPVLRQEQSDCPILLEVFTRKEDNETELKRIKQYYKTL